MVVPTAVVGYYDASAGAGVSRQVTAINLAGYTPVRLDTLSPTELAGVNIILAQNSDNSSLGWELPGAKAAISDAVYGGKVFILHDFFVDSQYYYGYGSGTQVESFLPGFGGGDGLYRNFDRPRDINFESEALKQGPGGLLNDYSLDNGNYSSHGYASEALLPAGSVTLLNNGDPSQAVTFAYGYGSGTVVYSTIPLDAYIYGQVDSSLGGNMHRYTANLLALAGSGQLGGLFAPPDPQFALALKVDSGASASDFITNNGLIDFAGINNLKDEYYSYALNGQDQGDQYKGISTPLFVAADGTYDLAVKTFSFGQGGFLQQDQAVLRFTLDTVAQQALTGLAPGSDSGKFADDNYTNSLAFLSSGLEAGANVQFSLNGGASWADAITNPAQDGIYTIYTRQTDLAGNVSTPSAYTFTLDTVSATPSLAFNDTGKNTADRVTGDGRVFIAGQESGGSFQFRNNDGAWVDVDGAQFAVANGRHDLDVRQIDLAGNISQEESVAFAKRDLVFTHRLLEADGVTVADGGLEIASWGSVADKARQYVLEISAESLAGISIDDLDLTLNFNNSLFEVVNADDIQITSKLPLANAALIHADNGGLRVAAGSASHLADSTGSGILDEAKVLRLLVNLKDDAYTGTDHTRLLNQAGEGALTAAGITIAANLDETVFADLSTLRDRGGVEAYQTLSNDIAVTRAATNLSEAKADPIVLGTQRTIGGDVFTNLIRRGDSVVGRVATWTNTGEASATGVELSLKPPVTGVATLELKVADQVGTHLSVTDLEITRQLDGSISQRDTLAVDLKVTATGAAGSVIDLNEAGYTISSNGGYNWQSSNLESSKNLITYQGDLNYDGRVSMKDLAFLNAGAQAVAEGGGVSRDVDANFDNAINLADLAVLDADWGQSLHTGADQFLGSNQVRITELAQQGEVLWNDRTFQNQNVIEASPEFQATLDAPAVAAVIDGDGLPGSTPDIQGAELQNSFG
jgi:hypothetical protein